MKASKRKINNTSVFKLRTKNDDNNELSLDIVLNARKTGKLTLSSKGLSTGKQKNKKICPIFELLLLFVVMYLKL